MQRTHVLVLVLFMAALAVLAAGQQVSPSSVADEVIATMHAIKSADLQAWNELVSPNCSFVEPNGRIETGAFHAPSPQPATALKPKKQESELRVREYGDTAVLTYREDLQVDIADNPTRSATRYSEVYQRASGKWRLIFSAETPIPLPAVIKMDPRLLDDYVGEYQMTPQLIGRVYREGSALMLMGTGWKQPYELLPTATDTFVVKGMEQNEITFVRGADGKVTGQSSKLRSQQQATAKKIK